MFLFYVFFIFYLLSINWLSIDKDESPLETLYVITYNPLNVPAVIFLRKPTVPPTIPNAPSIGPLINPCTGESTISIKPWAIYLNNL
jgi:hypothetical protein